MARFLGYSGYDVRFDLRGEVDCIFIQHNGAVGQGRRAPDQTDERERNVRAPAKHRAHDAAASSPSASGRGRRSDSLSEPSTIVVRVERTPLMIWGYGFEKAPKVIRDRWQGPGRRLQDHGRRCLLDEARGRAAASDGAHRPRALRKGTADRVRARAEPGRRRHHDHGPP